MSFDIILEELEKINGKLDRLLVSGSNKFTVDIVEPKKELVVTEKLIIKGGTTIEGMDFSQVTVMNQTEKALLVVKKGKQQWLAKQFIKDPLIEYFTGCMYNIVLKEQSDSGKPIGWITKKWEDFEVFKG